MITSDISSNVLQCTLCKWVSSSCDCFIFSKIKSHLRGRHFGAVWYCLEHQKGCNQPTESSFSRIIPTLTPKGNYFEGDNVHFSLNNKHFYKTALITFYTHLVHYSGLYIYIWRIQLQTNSFAFKMWTK